MLSSIARAASRGVVRAAIQQPVVAAAVCSPSSVRNFADEPATDRKAQPAPKLRPPHHTEEGPEEFDQRFVDYFNRDDLDGWMIRRGMTELQGHDVIPEPKIVAAALRACRRVNDYALAIRFLESIKVKCGPKKYVDIIYPYIIQEVKPVLQELGISTPEEMGYDKPELWHPNPDWWPKRYYEEYGLDKNPKYNVG